jgi:hypothetical protein
MHVKVSYQVELIHGSKYISPKVVEQSQPYEHILMMFILFKFFIQYFFVSFKFAIRMRNRLPTQM